MAIQTGGFQVQQMPQYTAPDPRLAAFSPNLALNGMVQAFDAAKALEAVKASRLAQVKQMAIQQAQIQALNATNTLTAASDTAALPTVLPKRDLELLKIGQDTQSVPLLGEQTRANAVYQTALSRGRGEILTDVLSSELETAKLTGATAAGERFNLPVVQGAAHVAAQVNMGNSEIQRATQPERYNTAMAQARGDAARAAQGEQIKTIQQGTVLTGVQGEAGRADRQETLKNDNLRLAQQASIFAQINGPVEQQIKMIELQDKIQHATSDSEKERLMKDAKMSLVEAQTAEARADAMYKLGLGRQTGTQTKEDLVKDASRIEDAIKKTDGFKLDDGRTLGVYLKETYENGTIGTSRSIKEMWLKANVNPTDKLGEVYKDQRDALEKALIVNTAKISQMYSAENPSPAATKSGPPTIKTKSEYDAFIKANPSGTPFIGSDGKPYKTP